MVEHGLAESRTLAQRLVMAGQVRVDGQVALKPSDKILTRKPNLSRFRTSICIQRRGET